MPSYVKYRMAFVLITTRLEVYKYQWQPAVGFNRLFCHGGFFFYFKLFCQPVLFMFFIA
jgi:hypothetical protein